jgi:hypothetical protein
MESCGIHTEKRKSCEKIGWNRLINVLWLLSQNRQNRKMKLLSSLVSKHNEYMTHKMNTFELQNCEVQLRRRFYLLFSLSDESWLFSVENNAQTACPCWISQKRACLRKECKLLHVIPLFTENDLFYER